MKLEDCKPGVRVAVYEGLSDRFTGTITNVDGDLITVVDKDGGHWTKHHPQQLRRLRKKEKRKPREVTLYEYADGALQTYSQLVGPGRITCGKPVLFREVIE